MITAEISIFAIENNGKKVKTWLYQNEDSYKILMLY